MIKKYRADIDGLRAIAVLMVVIYHAFPNALPGGFIGVDIFFVISGYLITSILNNEAKTDSYSIKEFYRRRIDRLFPALLLVMFSVYGFGWLTLFSDEFMQLGKQLAGGAGFVANIVLYSETGYFNATSATKPFLHLWSLGIEEQFYLAFPLIFIITHKRKCNPVLVISILAALSFYLNIVSIKENIERTFYLPQYRHWELLLGSVLAIIVRNEEAKLPKKSTSFIISLCSILSLIYTSLTLDSTAAFPGWYALIPVLASVALIWTMQSSGPINFVISSKPFVLIGLISYPLYLWHWPIFSLARIINGSAPPNSVMLALMALSFLLATLTFLLIEKPLKYIKSWRIKTIPMLMLMTVIGSTGYITYIKNGIDDRANIKINKEVSRQINGSLWQYTQNSNCLERFKSTLATTLPWWFCSLKRNADPDILLLGNSYANHLYPGIANNTHIKDLNVLSIGITDVASGISISDGKPLDEHAVFINKIIENTKSIKYILISGIPPKVDQPFIDRLIKRMPVITSNGAKVVIFYPHVRLSDDIKSCFSRPLKKPQKTCETDLTELNSIHKEFNNLKERVIASYPNTMFFDPNIVFCDNKKCTSVRNGMPMYRDESKHWSEFASMSVGDVFSQWARNNLPEIVR